MLVFSVFILSESHLSFSPGLLPTKTLTFFCNVSETDMFFKLAEKLETPGPIFPRISGSNLKISKEDSEKSDSAPDQLELSELFSPSNSEVSVGSLTTSPPVLTDIAIFSLFMSIPTKSPFVFTTPSLTEFFVPGTIKNIFEVDVSESWPWMFIFETTISLSFANLAKARVQFETFVVFTIENRFGDSILISPEKPDCKSSAIFPFIDMSKSMNSWLSVSWNGVNSKDFVSNV